MRRRGITLVEMLVATGIFLLGFVGIFGLFLAGVKFRKQGDDLTRCSLAISSLTEEFRIDAGREGLGSPPAPSEYVGDGFAANGPEDTDPGEMIPYAMQQGVWYRVLTCTDLQGGDNALTTGIKMRLLVLPWPTADTTLNLTEVARRLRLDDGGGTILTDPALIAATLVQRQIALQADLVLVRHPPP